MKMIQQSDRLRKIAVVLLAALIYACMYSVGSEIQTAGTCSIPVVLRKIAVSFVLFSGILLLILHFCHKEKVDKAKIEKTFHIGLAFIVLLIPYVLYWITVFPGHFTYDTPAQMVQIIKGEYSAHHPLIHTLLFQLFLSLQETVGSVEVCVAVYIGFQIMLMALLFALSCGSMARTFGYRAGWGACVFFAIYPMHALFAAQMTKDSLFTGFFTLFFALTTEGVIRGKYSTRLLVGMGISGIFAVLFRNNMIYALIVWLIVLVLILRHIDKKKLMVSILCIVTFAFGTGKMLQTGLDAQSVDIREMLSWPAQQITRARVYGWDGFTGSDRYLFERFLPGDRYLKYEPMCSDAIKLRMSKEFITESTDDFLELYFSVGRKCKQEYLDAVAELTYPLLYPYPNYSSSRPFIETGIKKESFDVFFGEGTVTQISTFEKYRQWMDEHIWNTGATNIPILRWLLNIGVATWLLLFSITREAYDGHWERFAVQLLPFLYWGTVLLGPVMQGRYIYPIICVLPFMLCTKKKVKEHEL